MLGGLAAGGMLGGCGGAEPTPAAPVPGTLRGFHRMERGHRVWSAPAGAPSAAAEADVCIVGAGMAGISAAWRLRRAGFGGRVVWLDLGDAVGGTSRDDGGPSGPHPLGAHYLTVPGRSARHVREMLLELGVLRWTGVDQPPALHPRTLALAPQERLFVRGRWVEGLWPADLASDEDERQRAAFEAEVERWTAKRGADGRYAFDLPVARCSQDPEIRALAGQTFADWLDAHGFTSKPLRWQLEYGTRDDFGTELQTTSAWAGLHYHCCRRPWVSRTDPLGTQVLTWPGGNGWLVRGLTAGLPWTPTLGAVARQVEPDTGRVWYEVGQELREVRARAVVLAVPAAVASRLVDRERGRTPVASPWTVASLHVRELPSSRGVSTAWDSVLYDTPSLGYVTNSHQSGSFGGPSVLTWYRPWSQADVGEARRAAAALTHSGLVDTVMEELSGPHPDLRKVLERLDGWVWGHGTVRPEVGWHASGALDALRKPLGRVTFAHTDLSGMSLFEEASWHGIRAAETVLGQLGLAVGDSLL